MKTCARCKGSLEVRPVMKRVKGGHPNGPPFFQKRVHCKPTQLVVTVRVEGSDGLMDGANKLKLGWQTDLRLCHECIGTSRTPLQVLAVALDQLLIEGKL
jgi:hypothetical protein